MSYDVKLWSCILFWQSHKVGAIRYTAMIMGTIPHLSTAMRGKWSLLHPQRLNQFKCVVEQIAFYRLETLWQGPLTISRLPGVGSIIEGIWVRAHEQKNAEKLNVKFVTTLSAQWQPLQLSSIKLDQIVNCFKKRPISYITHHTSHIPWGDIPDRHMRIFRYTRPVTKRKRRNRILFHFIGWCLVTPCPCSDAMLCYAMLCPALEHPEGRKRLT